MGKWYYYQMNKSDFCIVTFPSIVLIFFSWQEWRCLYFYFARAWRRQVWLWEARGALATHPHSRNHYDQRYLHAGRPKRWLACKCGRCGEFACLLRLSPPSKPKAESKLNVVSLFPLCRKSGGRTETANSKGKLLAVYVKAKTTDAAQRSSFTFSGQVFLIIF